MKRFFAVFFILFFIAQSLSVNAQIATSGGVMSGDGILIPGLTCGIAGDPDPAKTKCCVPKRPDDSVINTISDVGSGLPVIGGFIKGYIDKVDSVNATQNNMPPCVGDPNVIVPSTPNALTNKTCICIQNTATASAIPELSEFCRKYFPLSSTSNEIQKCSQCVNTGGGFYTSLGCVPLDVSTFITSYILTMGIGIAGGVAFLCIIYSAFRMQTSMGNAEAIKKAQESMTSCITGLIIIIFSVLILKIIGVDILRIPGFGK